MSYTSVRSRRHIYMTNLYELVDDFMKYEKN